MSNPFLAEALLRASRPTFGLRVDITKEQQEEEKLYRERERARERRTRKYESASGKGRVVGGVVGGVAGGLLGFLIAGPGGVKWGASTGAGLGSAAGQAVATKFTPGTKLPEKFKRIGPGRYFVDIGEERQKQFEFEEDERSRYLTEQILTRAATDAISGYQAGKYGGGILDMILGSTPAQRASDPARNVDIMKESMGY